MPRFVLRFSIVAVTLKGLNNSHRLALTRDFSKEATESIKIAKQQELA